VALGIPNMWLFYRSRDSALVQLLSPEVA